MVVLVLQGPGRGGGDKTAAVARERLKRLDFPHTLIPHDDRNDVHRSEGIGSESYLNRRKATRREPAAVSFST